MEKNTSNELGGEMSSEEQLLLDILNGIQKDFPNWRIIAYELRGNNK